MAKQCQNCRFWKQVIGDESTDGVCRLLPPVYTSTPDTGECNSAGVDAWNYPWTRATQTCSHHKKASLKQMSTRMNELRKTLDRVRSDDN